MLISVLINDNLIKVGNTINSLILSLDCPKGDYCQTIHIVNSNVGYMR